MITTPIIVLIMAWIILKDKITVLKALGIITGGIGVAMLISSGAKDTTSPSSISGDICIMLNATSYAIFLVYTKPLMQKYAPLTIAKWIFFYGFFSYCHLVLKIFSYRLANNSIRCIMGSCSSNTRRNGAGIFI